MPKPIDQNFIDELARFLIWTRWNCAPEFGREKYTISWFEHLSNWQKRLREISDDPVTCILCNPSVKVAKKDLDEHDRVHHDPTYKPPYDPHSYHPTEVGIFCSFPGVQHLHPIGGECISQQRGEHNRIRWKTVEGSPHDFTSKPKGK